MTIPTPEEPLRVLIVCLGNICRSPMAEGALRARIESDEYIMLSGVANSLGEALQRATSGMSRYLSTTYGLNPAEAGIVMGSSMKYDIAEVVDPHIHVVAKLPRKLLERLAPQ